MRKESSSQPEKERIVRSSCDTCGIFSNIIPMSLYNFSLLLELILSTDKPLDSTSYSAGRQGTTHF
ncbi:hypothetical protein BDV28DRAFT_133630 [Aspergillus coremiiformis]|uniref:Uncharacterized protein n=1 Tax=Aspergillus coremiiformis TaxID=138285 RepID=A0A5N6Z7M7_9EURO|nr:hypothetical protein BDV28DRAFT_133630 [Aspergillus coremiiformis]